MMRLCLLLITFLSHYSSIVGSDAVVEISLADSLSWEGQLFANSSFSMGSGVTTVKISNIPEWCAFKVFSVYTFPKTNYIKLDTTNSRNLFGSDHSFVHSTDVRAAYFNITNLILEPINILITVHAYDDSYPVPGGCAMEFPISTAPYLMVEDGSEIITVKGQKGAVSLNDTQCMNNNLDYEFYFTYSRDSYESPDDYFALLQNFFNYTTLVDTAYLAQPMDRIPTQRIFAKYPRVCTFYSMAVKGPLGKVALYSPSSNLLCLQDSSSPLSLGRKALIGTLLPIGATLCFAGHSWSHLSVFFTSFFASQTGSYVGFAWTGYNLDEAELYAFYAGMIVAGILTLVLVMRSCPIVLAAIPMIGATYLSGALIFFLFAGNLPVSSAGYYWGVVAAVIAILGGLLCLAILSPKGGFIISLSFIGSYLNVYVIDYVMGTTIKYTSINPVRRLTVEAFNSAITSPPLETSDVVLLCVWMTLTVSGAAKQLRKAEGKAPFPPPPQLSLFTQSQERAPLLST